jgi:hypothetical protein
MVCITSHLLSQDGSEVVQDEIAIRIFFKFLQSESVWTQTIVQLDETLTMSQVPTQLFKHFKGKTVQ